MSKSKNIKNVVPNYTLGEELINSISHGIGAGLSIAGLVLIIIRAHDVIGIISSVIYATFMFNLYIISCIYHALSPRLNGKKVLRVLDHSNVLLMVAGTYTPICLCALRGALGWITFSFVWLITVVAIVLNCINIDKYQKLCLACNLGLGWASLLLIGSLLKSCPINGLILLIIGGIIYTIGAILYSLGSRYRYIHSLFHFFILAGSIFHYFFIYFYIV